MHMYGNCRISAQELLKPVLLRHRLLFTLNIVTALMFCYAVHCLGSCIPRLQSCVFHHCILDPSFSVPRFQYPFQKCLTIFWATLY